MFTYLHLNRVAGVTYLRLGAVSSQAQREQQVLLSTRSARQPGKIAPSRRAEIQNLKVLIFKLKPMHSVPHSDIRRLI